MVQRMMQTDPVMRGPYGVVNMGTSILALKYKDGVMIGADMALNYGGSRASNDYSRIHSVSDEVLFAASGEMADF